MTRTSVSAAVVSLIGVLSCGAADDSGPVEGRGGAGGTSEAAHVGPSSHSSSAATTGGYTPPSDSWDPCPIEEYEVTLKDGTVVVIRLRVFCDPRADIYRGCPAPDGLIEGR